MGEWTTKTKIMIVVALIILFLPIYMISEPGLQRTMKGAYAQRDLPSSPTTIYRCARVYEISLRPDKADQVYREWLRHYGGRWGRIQVGEQFGYFPWELDGANETALPKPVSDVPHPLTPDILNRIAMHYEKDREYGKAKFLWAVILTYFKDNPDGVKQASAGIARDKVRTF
jgi:hypothetical protein